MARGLFSFQILPGREGLTLYFFSVLPGYVEIFLAYNLGLYRSSSASFWLGLCENCSTCRCIFDVFVGGGEFHILLCQLDPFSVSSMFLLCFWILPLKRRNFL